MRKLFFILIFIVTIIAAKLTTFFIPTDSPIWFDVMHHAYYGIILVLISMPLLKKKFYDLGYVLLAVGYGLIIEETAFIVVMEWILMQGGKEIYFSLIPNIGTIILAIISIVFVWKRKIKSLV